MNTKQAFVTCRAREPVGTAAKHREKSVSDNNINNCFIFYLRIIKENTLPAIGSTLGRKILFEFNLCFLLHLFMHF